MLVYATWVLADKRYLLYIAYSLILYTLANSLNLALNVSLGEMLAIGDSETARTYLVERLSFMNNLRATIDQNNSNGYPP